SADHPGRQIRRLRSYTVNRTVPGSARWSDSRSSRLRETAACGGELVGERHGRNSIGECGQQRLEKPVRVPTLRMEELRPAMPGLEAIDRVAEDEERLAGDALRLV